MKLCAYIIHLLGLIEVSEGLRFEAGLLFSLFCSDHTLVAGFSNNGRSSLEWQLQAQAASLPNLRPKGKHVWVSDLCDDVFRMGFGVIGGIGLFLPCLFLASLFLGNVVSLLHHVTHLKDLIS